MRVPEGLLNDLLPGPVTLVMERSEELNKDLNPFTPVSQVLLCPQTLAIWLLLGSKSDPLPTPSSLSDDALSLASKLVGVRIPDHAFMQDLAQVFGGPLALTSANLSSQASSLNVQVRPSPLPGNTTRPVFCEPGGADHSLELPGRGTTISILWSEVSAQLAGGEVVWGSKAKALGRVL